MTLPVMTMKMNAIRQSNLAAFSGEQPLAWRTGAITPRLRRTAHLNPGVLAGAILVSLGGDVNRNLGTSADEFAGVTPDVNAALIVLAGEAVAPAKASRLSGAGIAAAALDEEEEEDEDEDDEDDYEDDDLDEDEDEDLDDDEEEDLDDDDLDEDDDLEDDDLDDDEDEEDEEE